LCASDSRQKLEGENADAASGEVLHDLRLAERIAHSNQSLPFSQKLKVFGPSVPIRTGGPDLADDVSSLKNDLSRIDQLGTLRSIFLVEVTGPGTRCAFDEDLKPGLCEDSNLSGNERGSTFSGEAFSGNPNNLPGSILRHSSVLRQLCVTAVFCLRTSPTLPLAGRRSPAKTDGERVERESDPVLDISLMRPEYGISPGHRKRAGIADRAHTTCEDTQEKNQLSTPTHCVFV